MCDLGVADNMYAHDKNRDFVLDPRTGESPPMCPLATLDLDGNGVVDVVEYTKFCKHQESAGRDVFPQESSDRYGARGSTTSSANDTTGAPAASSALVQVAVRPPRRKKDAEDSSWWSCCCNSASSEEEIEMEIEETRPPGFRRPPGWTPPSSGGVITTGRAFKVDDFEITDCTGRRRRFDCAGVRPALDTETGRFGVAAGNDGFWGMLGTARDEKAQGNRVTGAMYQNAHDGIVNRVGGNAAARDRFTRDREGNPRSRPFIPYTAVTRRSGWKEDKEKARWQDWLLRQTQPTVHATVASTRQTFPIGDRDNDDSEESTSTQGTTGTGGGWRFWRSSFVQFSADDRDRRATVPASSAGLPELLVSETRGESADAIAPYEGEFGTSSTEFLGQTAEQAETPSIATAAVTDAETAPAVSAVELRGEEIGRMEEIGTAAVPVSPTPSSSTSLSTANYPSAAALTSDLAEQREQDEYDGAGGALWLDALRPEENGRAYTASPTTPLLSESTSGASQSVSPSSMGHVGVSAGSTV
ncbi:unnamed protein product [Amoebophrya sp. A120]|nr:unnamed protein product [Amoebophrya sp. A120]|eukprot:GSA120T00005943001.1